MTAVAFIGLGVMGFPMAGHLHQAGHQTSVYNRSADKMLQWQQQHGGARAATSAEAASNAEIVFCCVGNDDDLRAVTLGEHGAFAGMRPGTLFVDHTSASASIARELATLARQRDIAFIDAPVSGGQAGAESGRLTVMAGGDAEDIARAEPLIRCYAANLRRIGDHGHGQLAKMVNQICIAGVIQSLAEALNFGVRAGIDMESVIQVISNGAAQSWQMENRYRSMLENYYEHGFAVDWMRKDLSIVFEEARNNGSRLPVASLVDQFYAEVQAMGGGRWDTSSLLARLQLAEEDTKADD